MTVQSMAILYYEPESGVDESWTSGLEFRESYFSGVPEASLGMLVPCPGDHSGLNRPLTLVMDLEADGSLPSRSCVKSRTRS